MKRLFVILALLLSSAALFAQKDAVDDHGRRPYYGFIISASTREPIRNTHVISKMAHCGTITDRQGKFHIQARSVDTLWVSCIGYTRRLVALDSRLTSSDTLVIRLYPETITLREVTVLPFTNYEDFKQMLITMPSVETPDELKRLNEDLDELWLSRVPTGNGKPTITANPIQYLYDKYNASARRQATLLRNRRMYNEVLREQGRTDELLPDSLDFAIDYKMYELDEAKETSTMVPRKKKKYIHVGQ